eukprot:scaffold30177_cov67-Skeletonema_dohrnii-CCMP3373.AAC.3
MKTMKTTVTLHENETFNGQRDTKKRKGKTTKAAALKKDAPPPILCRNETADKNRNRGRSEFYSRDEIGSNDGLLSGWEQPINQGNKRTIKLTRSKNAVNLSKDTLKEYMEYLVKK